MSKFGTIVLIPFPFTDLTSTKLRPALIVSRKPPSRGDVVLCFITSKPSEGLEYSFRLKTTDAYFRMTGLKTDSAVRFDKIATLNSKLILGELGHIHTTHQSKMKRLFYRVFGF